MVKINELRVGNIISDVDGFIFTITEEIMDDIIQNGTANLRPIEITEKWLRILNFEKSDRAGRYGYRYHISINDYNYVIQRDFNEHISHFFGFEYTDAPNSEEDHIPHNFSYDLKYVHRLQNIFFFVAGFELTDYYNR